MKVIVPCCGLSSRFPNQPPKWMLPGHDGRPMLALALSGLEVSPEDVVVAILREHEEQYGVCRGLDRVFAGKVRVVVHEKPTRNQAETVARTLERAEIGEPFLVKDSDNRFRIGDLEQDANYVCVESLNHFDSINPRNKSYLQVDHRGLVTNIREKVVISDLFSVGGYFFTSPEQFLTYFRRLESVMTTWTREMYISDVIGAMILDGIPFRSREVSQYEDWGTIHEWRKALQSRRAYLVMVDGFVLEKGSEHFHPLFEEVKPNAEAVKALGQLAAQGNTILYLSTRPASLSELTTAQLAAAGAPAAPVLFGCPVASLTLVSAPHPTLPFLAGSAIEVSSNDSNLLEKLRGDA